MSLNRLFRLLGALLLLAAVAMVWRIGDLQWQRWRDAERSRVAVDELADALRAAEMVSRERGPTNGLLGESVVGHPQRHQAVKEARQRTDLAFARLSAVLTPGHAAGHDHPPQVIQRFEGGREALATARAEVDRLAALPKADRRPGDIRAAVQRMVAIVPNVAPAISALAGEAQQALPELSDAVTGARLAAELREYAGQLGSLFTPALSARQVFSSEERDAIERIRGRIDELMVLLDLHLQSAPALPEVGLARQRLGEQYLVEAGALVARVISTGREDGRFDLDPAAFAAQYVPPMNSILALRDTLLDEARSIAAHGSREARNALAMMAAGSAALLLLLGMVMGLVHVWVLRPLSNTATALQAMARGELDIELPPARTRDEMAAVIGAVHALHRHGHERQALETERADLIERLRELSNTDFLTGLMNRRAFIESAEQELARARRHGFELALVMLDIDHFKQVNDRHGHATGDAALQAVAASLRETLRAGDLAARFGGEEFVVLLSHSAAKQAGAYAERLRQQIAQQALMSAAGVPVPLSVSVGVASTSNVGDGLETVLAAADAAMYLAKQHGRNRVHLAEPRLAA